MKKSRKNFNLQEIVNKAKIFNAYCLPILTVYPNNFFKRKHYFPELLINMPESYHRYISHGDSAYMGTVYLKQEEAATYRLFVNDGLIVYVEEQEGEVKPYHSEGASMVVLTEEGRLFSAKKQEGIHLQHTSFNRAGYLLFAGYWKIEHGRVKTIVAQSGHYEPSIVSLQNFVKFLTYACCQLTGAEFIFANRSAVPSESTGDLVLKSCSEQYRYEQLLGEKIKRPRLANSLLTPKELHLINEEFFADRQENIAINNNNVLSTCGL